MEDVHQKKQAVLGVIPARRASTRLKDKMLLEIAGMPLIVHTFMRASEASTLTKLIVATDDNDIRLVCESAGATVVMTPDTIKSGTERVHYASTIYTDIKPEVIVNIQGDEPLIPIEAIDGTTRAVLEDTSVVCATPATVFPADQDPDSPSLVKVVCNQVSNALLFSRSKIPYPRNGTPIYLKHLGLYAFRTSFLETYTALTETPLEIAEQLEQLRILEHGYPIRVVTGNFHSVEVNNYEEYLQAKQIIEDK